MGDAVNHPAHYQGAAGVECIEMSEHLGFNLGNAFKYVWRCDAKHPDPIEDLKKARWYLHRERARRAVDGVQMISLPARAKGAMLRVLEVDGDTARTRLLKAICKAAEGESLDTSDIFIGHTIETLTPASAVPREASQQEQCSAQL